MNEVNASEMALVSHPTASGQMFVQQEAKKSSQRGIPVAAQALPALPQQVSGCIREIRNSVGVGK